MTTSTLAGREVDRNEEGFFTDPMQWNRSMAPELAAADGIDRLTDEHWAVLDLMRREYASTGTGPTVRALSRISGIPIKRLYELFPGGPAKVAARVAGIPKPRGCI
jgi:tRNA 2-thiouridine synthesizing protein E